MTFPLVLMYHAVCRLPVGALEGERRLIVEPDRFAEQMRDLSGRGFRSISLDEYAARLRGHSPHSKTVLLTFDDAYAHVDEAVTPVLRRHGFQAVMFVPFGHLGERNTWDAGRLPYLATLEIASAGQIRGLDPGVWGVASHGFRHVDLRCISEDRRRFELAQARRGLSELARRPVVDIAYPHGASDVAVRRDAERAGYRMAFTARSVAGASRFQLPRRRIDGQETLATFRMKTSVWSGPLYGASGIAPEWARRTARTLLWAAQGSGTAS